MRGRLSAWPFQFERGERNDPAIAAVVLAALRGTLDNTEGVTPPLIFRRRLPRYYLIELLDMFV